jgi:hypothetical protein
VVVGASRDARRHRRHVVGVRDARQQHRELVAAEARDQVAAARALEQHRGHAHQQRVAGGVALRVVDLLEVVEVDEDHRHVLARRIARQRLLDAIAEERAVGQSGQGVVEGTVRQLRLERAVRRHVVRDHEHALDRAVLGDRHGRQLRGAAPLEPDGEVGLPALRGARQRGLQPLLAPGAVVGRHQLDQRPPAQRLHRHAQQGGRGSVHVADGAVRPDGEDRVDVQVEEGPQPSGHRRCRQRGPLDGGRRRRRPSVRTPVGDVRLRRRQAGRSSGQGGASGSVTVGTTWLREPGDELHRSGRAVGHDRPAVQPGCARSPRPHDGRFPAVRKAWRSHHPRP